MSEITESILTEASVSEADKESTDIAEKKTRRKRTKSVINTELTDSETEESINMESSIIKTGDVFETGLTLLYKSSAAPKHFMSIKGKFYIWDDEVVNGRVRLTDSPTGIGNVNRIIGWVNVTDIQGG